MIKFFKRKKNNLSYVDAHNRAFKIFQKASLIMLWAAVFNVFGLIITIIQYMTSSEMVAKFTQGSYLYNNVLYAGSVYQYSMCFSSNSFIFRLLETLTNNPYQSTQILGTPWFYVSIIAIAILFSAITSYLAVLARGGNFKALLANSIFYGIDTLMIIACWVIGEDMTYIWIMIGIHVIILFFVFIAIFEYVHLFEIEKLHDKEIKSKKEQIKEENDEIIIGGE